VFGLLFTITANDFNPLEIQKKLFTFLNNFFEEMTEDHFETGLRDLVRDKDAYYKDMKEENEYLMEEF